MATISAWAVGSDAAIGWFEPRPTMRPPSATTAPTGTSPAAPARRASSSAAAISASYEGPAPPAEAGSPAIPGRARREDHLAGGEVEEADDHGERHERQQVGVRPFEERIVRRRPAGDAIGELRGHTGHEGDEDPGNRAARNVARRHEHARALVAPRRQLGFGKRRVGLLAAQITNREPADHDADHAWQPGRDRQRDAAGKG